MFPRHKRTETSKQTIADQIGSLVDKGITKVNRMMSLRDSYLDETVRIIETCYLSHRQIQECSLHKQNILHNLRTRIKAALSHQDILDAVGEITRANPQLTQRARQNDPTLYGYLSSAAAFIGFECHSAKLIASIVSYTEMRIREKPLRY